MIWRYIVLWVKGIPRALTSVFTMGAGAASIASFLGMRLAELPPIVPVGMLITTVATVLWQAAPRVLLNPADYVNKPIELSELDKMLMPVPRIALLGTSSVGKSTFVSRATHLEYAARETASPYAAIVAVPNKSPAQYIALVDTVGRKYPSAAAITAKADAVVVFVDNNDGSEDEAVKPSRVAAHLDIAKSNINPSLEESDRCRYVAVVANKSDLWGDDQKRSARMTKLVDEVRSEIAKAVPGKIVESIHEHSNKNAEHVSSLIRRISDNL